jgi:hypothetical protein
VSTLIHPRFLTVFAQIALGGATWNAATQSGDGIGTDVTYGAPATLTGYVVQAQLLRIEVALAGAQALNAPYWFLSAAAVAAGTRLTSVVDNSLVFLVQAGGPAQLPGLTISPLVPV